MAVMTTIIDEAMSMGLSGSYDGDPSRGNGHGAKW